MALRDRPTRGGPLEPVIIAYVDEGVELPVSIETDNTGPKPVIITDPNDTTRQNEFDNFFKALLAVDIEHHEIHEGDSFFYSELVTLGNGGIRTILIVTPNTAKRTHFLFSIVSSAQSEIEFFEDTITSNNGTALTALNRERDSANSAGTLIYHSPTITGDGSILVNEQIGNAAGGGAAKIGGNSLSRAELVLKTNSKYLFRVTSAAIGNGVSLFLDWYEHTSG